jgi:hypothetical protein
VCVGGVLDIIKKLLMRAIMFFETSLELKVCTISYGPPKWRESQFWEFQESVSHIDMAMAGSLNV